MADSTGNLVRKYILFNLKKNNNNNTEPLIMPSLTENSTSDHFNGKEFVAIICITVESY